ncbi:phospholipase D-like domain-containing protein [Alloprevotella tannerae]|uniref:phospholipase D-like domain-containing protein n=1 Tax=Alloprevotella tannerae TaxID=76122 RepID=UPI0039658C78
MKMCRLILLFLSLFIFHLSLASAISSNGGEIIITAVEHRELPTDDLIAQSDSQIVNYLKAHFDVPFTDNNKLVFFKTGQEKFDDLFAAIRQARRSIHLEYFNFRNDSISRALFDLLAKKAQQGVKIRALFDGFGNSSNNRPLRRKHLEALRAQGIEIYEFDPLRFPYVNHIFHRDHRKIVVIDGLVAYTGGMNVADYYIKGKPEIGVWRDLHVRVEGAAVGDLQRIFISFWNAVTHQQVQGPEYYPGEKQASDYFVGLKEDKDATAGHKLVGVVNRDPDESPRIIHDTFVQAIKVAKTNITLINPYLTLCPHLRREIKRALRRGVEVQIMVSANSDIPITPRVVEHTVHRLMKKGAKVWFFEGGFHHSKIMMVDSTFSFVGSANLNSRSLSCDYECNLLIADRPSTAQLLRLFDDDRTKHCWQLTPDTWRTKFSKGRRFQAWFYQFLTPFL